jgi:hypothetical protein
MTRTTSSLRAARYRAIIAFATLFALVGPAAAFEYSGFRMGMTEAEVLSAARRYGYQLKQTDNGYMWLLREGGTGYVSLCNGRLFSTGTTLNANFHVFIGLVLERQKQYGEPEWQTKQAYASGGQQVSSLEAKWEDHVGRFQSSVSLLLYGAMTSAPQVFVSYSAHKHMCQR